MMRRNFRRALMGALLLVAGHGVASASGYKHDLVGNASAKTPVKPAPGLLLMADGDYSREALRWFADKAGNGHVVVLRVSTAGDIGRMLHEQAGGFASVETYLLSAREQSSDRKLLNSLRKADGIVLAGGNAARHARFWRGTPVAKALDAHVKAGKPLAAVGMALSVMGEFVGSSQGGVQALADPLGAAGALETGFLNIGALSGVVIDPRFRKRDRLGGLVALVAGAEAMSGRRPLLGLGMEEGAAIVVEADGRARIHASVPGAGVTVVRGGFSQQQKGRPMRTERIETAGAGVDSVLHLPSGRVDQPASQRRYTARDGVLTALQSPLLAIHGGAGVAREDLLPGEEDAARAALAAALRAGHAQLKAGKPALDAVAAAITVLEDAPEFNAGRGSVFNHYGIHELDTSIMDGATGRVGAAAGLRHVKNPILLAQRIMDHSPYVMMVGDGAEVFAKEQGIQLVEQSYFHTEKRRQQQQRAIAAEKPGQARVHTDVREYFGTVGAVALDNEGKLAAGTSTGGMNNKRHGRVGDSPIIGAGTWADERCAVSGTGWGEYYIRVGAAHEICARVRLAGESLARAAEDVINKKIPSMGGNGGVIALDAVGNVAFPINTPGMYRGWIGEDGIPHVAVYANESLPMP